MCFRSASPWKTSSFCLTLCNPLVSSRPAFVDLGSTCEVEEANSDDEYWLKKETSLLSPPERRCQKRH